MKHISLLQLKYVCVSFSFKLFCSTHCAHTHAQKARRRNKLMDTASTDSDSDMKRRKIRRKDKRSESSSDSESEDNERHQSRKKKAKKERKSHKKHKKRKSKRRKNSKDKRGHASNSDLDEDRKNELENQLLQTKQQSRVIQEDDWVEAPSGMWSSNISKYLRYCNFNELNCY